MEIGSNFICQHSNIIHYDKRNIVAEQERKMTENGTQGTMTVAAR
jgi:hypothetical protein